MTNPDSDGRTDFKSLIDRLDGIAIWTVSTPGEFEYVSAGADAIWGIPAEALRGDPSRVIDRTHPTDRERVRSHMQRSGKQVSEESYEVRAVHPDGTVRWIQTRQIPIRDGEGNLERVVGICTDITEQKRRELEFVALNRMVRHGIRNDLSVLIGWGELLEEYVDEGGKDSLEKVLSAAAQVVELTEVARDYAETVASGDEMAVEPVSLRAILRQEIDLRREFFPKAEFRVTGDIPDVEVKANEMLSSVFRKLLNNAVQHNDEERPIVESGVELLDGDVVVHVADNGPGVPAEMEVSLFEEDRKGIASSGRGIGLHLVRTLVGQYDGDVWTASNTPTGTVFHVRLSRAE